MRRQVDVNMGGQVKTMFMQRKNVSCLWEKPCAPIFEINPDPSFRPLPGERRLLRRPPQGFAGGLLQVGGVVRPGNSSFKLASYKFARKSVKKDLFHVIGHKRGGKKVSHRSK